MTLESILSIKYYVRRAGAGGRLLLLSLALLLAAAACADSASTDGDPTPTATAAPVATATPVPSTVNVVATSNIVADWVEQIGGEHAEVFGLLPPGADPHTFLPGAQDIARVADADLVLTIGLALEEPRLIELIDGAVDDPSVIVELGELIDPIEFADPHGHGEHDEHDEHDEHEAHEDEAHDEHEDEAHDEHDAHDGEGHDSSAIGRLIVADGESAHLSVIDLSTDEVIADAFDVAAPGAAVYASPNHRYAFALARGPEDADDRIHVFDSGISLVEHGDHYDLVQQPVSRLALEIAEERPIHFANSHGWSAIFADARGRVFLFNEAEMATGQGDYEPVTLDAGPQHGAAIAATEDLIIVTSNNPDYPDTTQNSLPLGVEVRDLDDRVVYDASNRDCPGMHGEAHNAEGAMFGCTGGVLFIHPEGDSFHHDFVPNPPEMRDESRIGSVYGHYHQHHFFGKASYFDGQSFADDGVWLIDPESGEFRQVFSDASAGVAFSADGEALYVLGADGVLYVLDGHDGDITDSAEVFSPSEDASPSFVVVNETLYLADPAAGRVAAVHLADLEVEEEWQLGGAPSRLAFVGLLSTEGEHGHEEEGHEDEAHEDEAHEEHGHEEEGHEEEGHDEHEGHEEEGHDEHGHEGHAHGAEDPHFWFDPLRVKIAVDDIAARLSALNPDAADAYAANAAAYKAELDALHAWTQEQVASVPQERRLLVTSHDSLGYFAKLYGFEVVGTVIPSFSTDVEPSADDLANLIDDVKRAGAPAVFGETTVSERLAGTVASESGARLVRLYSGSLGEEGSGAETYLGMARTNAELITGALR